MHSLQQLRSLITELTMGPDIMKLRRNNIRSATITLIVIITAYLISNLLNMMITLFEFLWPGYFRTIIANLHLRELSLNVFDAFSYSHIYVLYLCAHFHVCMFAVYLMVSIHVKIRKFHGRILSYILV